MGGFLGIGGSSVKTDRAHELQGFGDLQNVFNFAMPLGQQLAGAGQKTIGAGLDLTKQGVGGIDQALAYWQKLLSGNRAQMQQAVAPETNQATAQADAAKRQLASSGTARGGGTAGVSRSIDDATMAAIDNLLFGVRPAAAQQEGQLATEKARLGLGEASVGTSELAAATNALGLGETAGANLADIASGSRATSNAINMQTQQNVANAIEEVLTALA